MLYQIGNTVFLQCDNSMLVNMWPNLCCILIYLTRNICQARVYAYKYIFQSYSRSKTCYLCLGRNTKIFYPQNHHTKAMSHYFFHVSTEAHSTANAKENENDTQDVYKASQQVSERIPFYTVYSSDRGRAIISFLTY